MEKEEVCQVVKGWVKTENRVDFIPLKTSQTYALMVGVQGIKIVTNSLHYPS